MEAPRNALRDEDYSRLDLDDLFRDELADILDDVLGSKPLNPSEFIEDEVA